MNVKPSLLLSCCFVAIVGVPFACAQDADPYPRVSEEVFRARLQYFEYNSDIPLEPRTQRTWDRDRSSRDRIVFRGAQGFLVPGYLEWPTHSGGPHPLVLLLHGWSGSKEDWYLKNSIVSGMDLRKGLLDAGYAILALDAATHGERNREIEYQPVNAYLDANGDTWRNPFTFTEINVQTVKDYRRALDYVSGREEIDTSRIGLVGYSMGGMEAFYLLSVEPRIKMAVACVTPLRAQYGPMTAIDYTYGVGDRPLLMLMGRRDDMYAEAEVEASYRRYIENPNTKLIWYDRPHELTREYVPDAVAWVKEHL